MVIQANFFLTFDVVFYFKGLKSCKNTYLIFKWLLYWVAIGSF